VVIGRLVTLSYSVNPKPWNRPSLASHRARAGPEAIEPAATVIKRSGSPAPETGKRCGESLLRFCAHQSHQRHQRSYQNVFVIHQMFL
jgi:hypothetical protein